MQTFSSISVIANNKWTSVTSRVKISNTTLLFNQQLEISDVELEAEFGIKAMLHYAAKNAKILCKNAREWLTLW